MNYGIFDWLYITIDLIIVAFNIISFKIVLN